jgi:hypothetical protein
MWNGALILASVGPGRVYRVLFLISIGSSRLPRSQIFGGENEDKRGNEQHDKSDAREKYFAVIAMTSCDHFKQQQESEHS